MENVLCNELLNVDSKKMKKTAMIVLFSVKKCNVVYINELDLKDLIFRYFPRNRKDDNRVATLHCKHPPTTSQSSDYVLMIQ